MSRIEVGFYRTASGRAPVKDYIHSIHPEGRSVILETLRDIGKYGLKSVGANFKHISGKLWEIKIDSNRIFYVMIDQERMMLLHAYKKQGQKLPRRELKLALKRMKEVLS